VRVHKPGADVTKQRYEKKRGGGEKKRHSKGTKAGITGRMTKVGTGVGERTKLNKQQEREGR